MCIGSAILKTLVNLGNIHKMGKIFLLGLKMVDFGRKKGILGANLERAGYRWADMYGRLYCPELIQKQGKIGDCPKVSKR